MAEFTEEQAAAMFPNSDHTPKQPEFKPQPSPRQQQEAATAAALYTHPSSPKPEGVSTQNEIKVEVPENVAELRKGEFYDATGTYRDVKFDMPESATPDERRVLEAAHNETRRIFADFQLPAPEASHVVELFHEHTRTPPSADTVSSWEAEARYQLRREFGSDAEEALRDAQRLAQRDKRVFELLAKTGMGSHPDIVLRMARAARSQRMRGRLK